MSIKSEAQFSDAIALSSDERLERASENLLRTFPDLRCLRCGHDNFYLLNGGPMLFRGEITNFRNSGINLGLMETVDLVCEKCGLIEKHGLPMLEIDFK